MVLSSPAQMENGAIKGSGSGVLFLHPGTSRTRSHPMILTESRLSTISQSFFNINSMRKYTDLTIIIPASMS